MNIKARMYITGDRGGNINSFENNKYLDGLQSGDYLFIAGDFSFIFSPNEKNMWETMKLDIIARKKYITCFVDGNHENFCTLYKYPVEKWNGGLVHVIRRDFNGKPKIVHLMRGEIYEINDKRIFSFGGAHSQDNKYRKRNVNWWPEHELPNAMEMEHGLRELKRNSWEVDYIITHTLPEGVFKKEYQHSIDIQEKELREYLEQIRNRCRFSSWYSGHIHQDLFIDKNHISLFDYIRDMETNEVVGSMKKN